MPRRSERSYLIGQFEFVLRSLIVNGEEGSKEWKQIIELYAGIVGTRCLNARQLVPKSDAMVRLLMYYPEPDFKQMVRMDKLSFIRLVERTD
jgi:hypothetical protein